MVGVAFAETWWTGTGLQEAFAVAGSAPGPVRDGMKYGQYIWNLAFIVVLIVQIRRSFAWENKLQIEQLSEEDQSIITPDELKLVKGERLFFKRRYGDFSKAVGPNIVLYQNLLAMQKHSAALLSVPLNKVEPVAALRGAIQALRGTLAAKA